MEIKHTYTFDILGNYQQPILDTVSKSLPGAAADYAPMPFGKVVLIVTWPGFEGRNESEREHLVRDSILASLKINPSEYISGFYCWTPKEAEDIKKAGEGTTDKA